MAFAGGPFVSTGGMSLPAPITDPFIPSAYTIPLDDTFPGTTLNTNMTAATPASISISGNVLTFASTTLGYSDNHVYLKTQAMDQKCTLKIAAGASVTGQFGPMVRRQGVGATADCYVANPVLSGTTLAIYKIVAGTPTSLATVVTGATYANGYYVTLEAIGTAPTQLVATMTDLSGNHIATCNANDNSATLQTPGSAGYACWTSGSVQISEAIFKQRPKNGANGTDVILCVGDSITAGTGTTGNNNLPYQLGVQYAALTGRGNTIINQGVGGTTSAGWATDAGSIRTTAIAAANAKGAVICSIMLGTNDSKESVKTSTASYLSNMQTLCSALFAGIPTLRSIILHKPPYHGVSLTDFQGASLARLQDYNENLFSICSGTNGVGILKGDSSWYGLIAANPTYLGDNIHPGDVGAPIGGKLQANAIYRALGL